MKLSALTQDIKTRYRVEDNTAYDIAESMLPHILEEPKLTFTLLDKAPCTDSVQYTTYICTCSQVFVLERRSGISFSWHVRVFPCGTVIQKIATHCAHCHDVVPWVERVDIGGTRHAS